MASTILLPSHSFCLTKYRYCSVSGLLGWGLIVLRFFSSVPCCFKLANVSAYFWSTGQQLLHILSFHSLGSHEVEGLSPSPNDIDSSLDTRYGLRDVPSKYYFLVATRFFDLLDSSITNSVSVTETLSSLKDSPEELFDSISLSSRKLLHIDRLHIISWPFFLVKT